MRFKVEHRVSAVDALALYRAFRDQSLEYLKSMPAIHSAEMLDASPAARRIHWRAKGDVPAAVKAFVKPSDLHWVEETRWDDGSLEARTVVTRPGSDVLHCQSVLRFRPQGDGVHVECEGDLKIKLPLVGSMVEYAAARAIKENMGLFLEEFARSTVQPPASDVGAPPAAAAALAGPTASTG
ncbi:MAG TPA: DUF2505 family protein [Candidatus Thermoplasmatota archaeon]|nr:DUF2505 family protein [Candidatus Thermoplasmatota archaeon]